jgi:thiamine biosynthesis lipoprotein
MERSRQHPGRALTLALALAGCVTGGCGREPGSAWVTTAFQGPTMGTAYTVKVVSSEPLTSLRQAEVSQAIERVLADVDAKMSTYRDDSELSRFNRFEGTTPFAVSRETIEVFETSLAVSRLSGGAFDATVGPLVDAWGFGPDVDDGDGPSRQDLADLLGRIGYAKLEIDPVALTLRKTVPKLACDLSAIAPGYAGDLLTEMLVGMGFSDFMVDVGGEVRAAGHNGEGGLWRIGIERPQLTRGGVERIVPLVDIAIATSGDYRNFREQEDGGRVTHIIDPRDGRPVHHRLTSATVLRPSCAEADGLATALMVLGPEAGMELAVREDLAVLLLVRDDAGGWDERMSPAFERYLEHAAKTAS